MRVLPLLASFFLLLTCRMNVGFLGQVNSASDLLPADKVLDISRSYSSDFKFLVFDLKGDVVQVLYRGQRDKGEYATTWDGRNRGGRIVARGIYFIKLVGPGINEIRKVLVVK